MARSKSPGLDPIRMATRLRDEFSTADWKKGLQCYSTGQVTIVCLDDLMALALVEEIVRAKRFGWGSGSRKMTMRNGCSTSVAFALGTKKRKVVIM